MKKRILTGALSLAMICAISASAFAGVDINVSGGSQSVPVELTVSAATFSVTVPTALPITVDAVGNVSTADNVYIENNSHGAVCVTDMSIDGVNGWEIVNYDTVDMVKQKVGAKKISMMINGDKTTADDTITFTSSNFPVMDGMNDSDTDKLKITYSAKLPAQIVALTQETVANIVFVVGWDS